MLTESLFVSQVGKSTCLTRFIPGLLRSDPDFGVGRDAEARFLRVGGANRFDRTCGVAGFLRSLLRTLLRETSRLGIRTSARLPPPDCQFSEPLEEIDVLLSELPSEHQYFILLDEVSALELSSILRTCAHCSLHLSGRVQRAGKRRQLLIVCRSECLSTRLMDVFLLSQIQFAFLLKNRDGKLDARSIETMRRYASLCFMHAGLPVCIADPNVGGLNRV